jgi:hypothetical protein
MSSDVTLSIYAHVTEKEKGETTDKFAAYMNF